MKTVVICLALLLSVSMVSADTISLTSGNASLGQQDSNITVEGAAIIVAGVDYYSSNVALQNALVIAPNHDWVTLPGSNWVGVADGESHSPNGGYIYKTYFELPTDYGFASINLTVTCDNFCDAYLNGCLLGTVAAQPPSTFTHLFYFDSSNQAMFVAGSNLLEFRVANGPMPDGVLNPSGLLYNAQITYVPEPASIIALLCGFGGIALKRRK